MRNDFVTMGYYICEYAVCPTFLGNIAEKIISISDCLCVHEPRIFLCHGWKPNGDNQEYIRSCFSSKEKYIKMSGEITNLLNEGLYTTDGRFLRKENAVHFYKEYFYDPKYILVSVSTKVKYSDLLGDKFRIEKDLVNEIDGDRIGCDIIGWDISVFHSFLCNGLEKEFPAVKFNSYGLLNEKYCEAEQMALKIQGMGEPVNWIPVILHKVGIK